MQISLLKAFTLVESLLVMLVLMIILQLSLSSFNISTLLKVNDELKVNQLITQLEFFKSKAIGENQSITLLLTENSSVIKVIEQKGKKYNFKIQDGKITYVSKIKTITFNKEGTINNFGSFILQIHNHLYTIIFHIDKGRIRYAKI
ncbi:competence protein [Staphylococcus devriesei]|uniref:Competence protein n=1 Tax=Staphylococcus devriesei TaxID=586733 RepID=A0ABX5I4R6_9STAP|nr:competence protein [Staphylococcus devriesei]PNZ86085.1 competence protein [Staphylococcus devriesei]PTF15467.1 competence protein [Staphylococcus devriesei]PTF17727.1 competence protein [Staphylococcus devriesei]